MLLLIIFLQLKNNIFEEFFFSLSNSQWENTHNNFVIIVVKLKGTLKHSILDWELHSKCLGNITLNINLESYYMTKYKMTEQWIFFVNVFQHWKSKRRLENTTYIYVT